MNGIRVRLVALGCLSLCWACAGIHSNAHLHVGGNDLNLRQFLRDNPLPKDQDIRIDLVASGPKTSVHVVQLRHGEKPHLHATHDLRVVMIRGKGIMVIEGKKIRCGAGSVFEIERGTPHYFINQGGSPAAALATFSPPYDGKDMIPVPAD